MGEIFRLKGKINNEFLTNIPVNLVNLFQKHTSILQFLQALDVKFTPALFGI